MSAWKWGRLSYLLVIVATTIALLADDDVGICCCCCVFIYTKLSKVDFPFIVHREQHGARERSFLKRSEIRSGGPTKQANWYTGTGGVQASKQHNNISSSIAAAKTHDDVCIEEEPKELIAVNAEWFMNAFDGMAPYILIEGGWLLFELWSYVGCSTTM